MNKSYKYKVCDRVIVLGNIGLGYIDESGFILDRMYDDRDKKNRYMVFFDKDKGYKESYSLWIVEDKIVLNKNYYRNILIDHLVYGRDTEI